MSILGNELKDLPSGDNVNGVLVGVEDLGIKRYADNTQHQAKLTWELEEQKSNGYRFTVHRTYNLNFSEFGPLGRDLKGWLGRSLNESECNLTFIKSLIGRTGNLKLQTKYN